MTRRDAVGGQAHPLGAVELGILKRSDAGQPIDQGRREAGAVDVYLVAQHHLDRLRQWAGDGCLRSLPGRRCKPRRFVFLRHRQAHAEDAPAPAGFVGQPGDLGRGDTSDRGQVAPLVGMWLEVVVEEYAVARLPWPVLQGQGYEIAESTRRQRILTGKQPVVGIEPDVRVAFHRLGDEPCAKTSSRRRRDRVREEDPQVAAVAGARPFQRRRHPQRPTGRQEHGNVAVPGLLVEVDGQEPAGLVGQHGVYADGEVASVRTPALEVAGDHLGGHRYERLVRALAALDPGLVADSRHPLVGAGGGVAGPATPCIAPAFGKHVLAAAKQRSEQSDFLSRRRERSYG